MATLFIIVLHLTTSGWKIDAAYQSRLVTASECREGKVRFSEIAKPRRDERLRTFCQAEPESA